MVRREQLGKWYPNKCELTILDHQTPLVHKNWIEPKAPDITKIENKALSKQITNSDGTWHIKNVYLKFIVHGGSTHDNSMRGWDGLNIGKNLRLPIFDHVPLFIYWMLSIKINK